MKNRIIDYFFEDTEQFEAYKPFLKLLGVLAAVNFIVSLLCL